MTDEDFEKHKSALEVKRTEKPKTMREQFSRYIREVFNFQYHFDRGKKFEFKALNSCQRMIY